MTVHLTEVPATAPIAVTVDGGPVSVPLPQVGQRGTLSFAGTAGSRVFLFVGSGPERLTATVRFGGQVVAAFSLIATVPVDFTPAQTGTYEVLVASRLPAVVGTWQFELYQYISAPVITS